MIIVRIIGDGSVVFTGALRSTKNVVSSWKMHLIRAANMWRQDDDNDDGDGEGRERNGGKWSGMKEREGEEHMTYL